MMRLRDCPNFLLHEPSSWHKPDLSCLELSGSSCCDDMEVSNSRDLTQILHNWFHEFGSASESSDLVPSYSDLDIASKSLESSELS
jgi:hypothetical protein